MSRLQRCCRMMIGVLLYVVFMVFFPMGFGSHDALAFDTAWHYLASGEVAEAYHFTPYSTELLHMGTFAPDYFYGFHIVGHLYEDLLEEQFEQLKQNRAFTLVPGLRRTFINTVNEVNEANLSKAQKAAVFLHFDNVNADLDSNRKFHFLFTQLLANTSQLILTTYTNPRLEKDTKRTIILFALGTSLHMVQDFYSHANWNGLDFASFGMPLKYSVKRVPTYFEACQFFGFTDNSTPDFPFLVQSGIYDVTNIDQIPLTQQGVPMTHAAMNHDNTQLINEYGEYTGRYHQTGLISGLVAPEKHQQIAVATAVAASKEWVGLLSQNPQVKEAITFAGRAVHHHLILKGEARSNIDGMKRSSCLLERWDGPHPTASQAKVCQRYKLTASSMLINTLRGSRSTLPSPTGKLWSLYLDVNILGQLVEGFSDPETGSYDFSFLQEHP